MMRRAASRSLPGIAPELVVYGSVLLIALAARLGGCGGGGYVPAPPAIPAPAPLLDGGAAKDAAAVCRPCIWGQPLPGQTCTETLCGCVVIVDGGMHCCCKEAK